MPRYRKINLKVTAFFLPQLRAKWIQILDNSLDLGIEVRLGICHALKANKDLIFKTDVLDHEKDLHSSLIYALIKLIIDDDYEIRKLMGNMLPNPKASILMFEDLLISNQCNAVVLQKLERELNKVSLKKVAVFVSLRFYF